MLTTQKQTRSETEHEMIVYGLACGFCSALRLELDPKVFASMAESAGPHPGPPGNGPNDLCDANMLMLAAWNAAVSPEIMDANNPKHCDLWNEAWELATRFKFDMREYLHAARAERTGNRSVPDDAAEFAIALGVHEHYSSLPDLDISDAYEGADEFMRRCMYLGRTFEAWCCKHVNFDELVDVWPYLLQDKVGTALVGMFGHVIPTHWEDADMLALAARMRLPIRIANTPGASMDFMWKVNLEWKGDTSAETALYQAYQLRTVRADMSQVEHYTVLDVQDAHACDNPNPVMFALYGSTSLVDLMWEFIGEYSSYPTLRTILTRMLGPYANAVPKAPCMQYPRE